MKDERKNKPSASSYEADALCPGRFQAQRGLPEPPQAEDAARGTRIHESLAGQRLLLDAQETDVANACKLIELGLCERLFGERKPIVLREHRLWLKRGRSKIFSGKADVIYLLDDCAAIFDYKTGPGDVEDASKNLQLRALAALAHKEWGIESAHVAIIQPLATHTPEVCSYGAQDLKRSLYDLTNHALKIQEPNQPRTPGEIQCKYCRAASICPAKLSHDNQSVGAIAALAGQSLAELPAEKIALALERLPIVNRAIDELKAEAKRRLEADPDSVPGFKLRPGATRTTITNAQEVFNRFLTAGGTAEQFMPCVSVAKGKLESAVRNVTGAKGAALDRGLATLLDGCTEEKQCEPSIVKA